VFGAEIDRDSPIPFYYQLQRILLQQIESGHFVPGKGIPSEKELERRYNLSRTTVRRALDELARAGHITRERGRGSFVTVKVEDTRPNRWEKMSGFLEELIEHGVSVGCRILFSGSVPAPPAIAKRFELEPGTPVYLLRRVGLAEGKPLGLAELWLAVDSDFGINQEELTKRVALQSYLRPLLLDQYGIILEGGEKTLEATLCTPEEAELLETVPGAPLLLARLLIRSLEGKPIVYIKALYRGDRYVYSIKLLM
jgi:GntR family transcriptional regulator